jgi:putative restriction endonuclease
MLALSKYINSFRKLHVDRSHGTAPHKPILLLSVLQGFRKKEITENRIRLTAELIAAFNENWNSLVRTNHDCRISYPFYYLKSDRFWKLIPRNGSDDPDLLGSAAKSFTSLNAVVESAELCDDLYLLMKDDEDNQILQQFLLEEYFPLTRINLSPERKHYSILDEIKKKILAGNPSAYRKEIQQLLDQKNEEEIFLRGSLFRREIPRVYDNTCCISGMRIDSKSSVSMIDACHIKPFSISHDDTVSNGIALCPNLHRAFDRGLITLSEDFKVIISEDFKENFSGYGIKSFEGKRIMLPDEKRLFPHQDNLEWHRKNIFRKELTF